jgi:hypothetical protein
MVTVYIWSCGKTQSWDFASGTDGSSAYTSLCAYDGTRHDAQTRMFDGLLGHGVSVPIHDGAASQWFKCNCVPKDLLICERMRCQHALTLEDQHI